MEDSYKPTKLEKEISSKMLKDKMQEVEENKKELAKQLPF
jgi:Tfp pilus assembly protein PilO